MAGRRLKASVNQPEGVAVDAAGNVYIADTLDHAVRKVTPDGVINTLAGTGNPGYSGDGGPANRARLSAPRAVAVDAAGNVYVADTGNNQVRRIDPLGTITTVDTGNALSDPRGVAVDRAGNVYIADTGNHRVRRVSPGAPVTTIAGNGTCCYSGDGALALDAQLNQPWGVAVDANGNVYVADPGNNAVRMLAPVSAGITVSAVTNAASNLAGAIAPGELVVMYGSGLGGRADGAVQRRRRRRCCTQRRARWVRWRHTRSAAGRCRWWCRARARPRRRWQWPSAATAPGVFTADGSGRGQAAAVNQDGTRNGPGAPAAGGSVLSLFATGEGQTCAVVDGNWRRPCPAGGHRYGDDRRRCAEALRGDPAADRGRDAGNVVVPGGLSGVVARGVDYGRSGEPGRRYGGRYGRRSRHNATVTESFSQRMSRQAEEACLTLRVFGRQAWRWLPGRDSPVITYGVCSKRPPRGGQFHGAERVVAGQDQDHVGRVQRILSGIS